MRIVNSMGANSATAESVLFRQFGRIVGRTENALLIVAIVTTAFLPLAEALLRGLFNVGIPGALGYLSHLTLWVGFTGAVIAARENQHLSLATGRIFEQLHFGVAIRPVIGSVTITVVAGLTIASVTFVVLEMSSFEKIGAWLPIWVAQAILPVSFALIAVHYLVNLQCGVRTVLLVVAGAGLIAATATFAATLLLIPGLVLLAASALLGAPIFVAVGGSALLLFLAYGEPIAAVPVATYSIAVSPLIPTIPLLTVAGYILAEGGARHRLIRLFRALFGHLPGGEAVAVVLLCAFFATFTGASSLAIVALGGLVLPILVSSRYPERFSLGLVTVSGSIGLLFPPSIAVILYGVAAHVAIPDLFFAGFLPGVLMVVTVAAVGVWTGLRAGVCRAAFDGREVLSALWGAKFELALPAVAAFGILGGFATLTETAAVVLAYVLLVEIVAHRDLDFWHSLPNILVRAGALVGALFAILGVAFGLGNFIVDSELSARAAEWVQSAVTNRIAFLLLLNVFLLIVGSVLDIFSAIVIIVPIISPIAAAYGIHPAHLGIIFLANLELGYLTPPVGLNLFLAAGRFDKSIPQICRASLPFFLVLLFIVLVITYVPELSLWWL
ncbi:MAG: TRAP transporter large permease subunit [Proteobacteria bacterium]|nr:TRAP transporter large permease subunit [Pseudomonadota bacterium]